MMRASLRVGSLLALLMMGCASPVSSSESAGEASGQAAEASSSSSSSSGAFAFFAVTRTVSGFHASTLNGAPIRGSWSDSADVASLDLSQLGLANADAQAIVDEVGTDARRPTLLFVGQVAQSRRAARLVAYEVWRAPSPVTLRGDVMHVSHGENALLVDWWDASKVTAMDLSQAPAMRVCALDESGVTVCGPSREPALSWAKSEGGLVVVGSVRRGVVRASQYFIRVDIGHAMHRDGYSYCREEQALCADTGCVSVAAECSAQTGRGRGLIPQIRTDIPAIQDWLVTTGQIAPIVVGP